MVAAAHLIQCVCDTVCVSACQHCSMFTASRLRLLAVKGYTSKESLQGIADIRDFSNGPGPPLDAALADILTACYRPELLQHGKPAGLACHGSFLQDSCVTA